MTPISDVVKKQPEEILTRHLLNKRKIVEALEFLERSIEMNYQIDLRELRERIKYDPSFIDGTGI